MKKIFIPLLISFSFSATAQWSIGGKAGVTFSNYKTKTPWEEVSNIGYSVGLTGFKKFNASFGLNLELQYIQKGYNHQICDEYYDKLKGNYIEAPILLDYGFIIPSMENFRAHINLGFYSAYWLSGKYETKIDEDAFSETFDFDRSGASRFDFGPSGGARVEYILKNGSLSLDFRYELGLIDLQKKANDDTNNTNHAMIIGISYLKLLGN